jgi:hypothetical protein
MIMTTLVGFIALSSIFALIWATTVNKWVELVCTLIVLALMSTALSFIAGLMVLAIFGK